VPKSGDRARDRDERAERPDAGPDEPDQRGQRPGERGQAPDQRGQRPGERGQAPDEPGRTPDELGPGSGAPADTAEIPSEGPAPGAPEAPAARRRRLAISAVFFSAATGLSRIAGLIREIVAASKFGVTGPMSAFTVAFQVPNLMRALFADAALQAAFVPVFTELLEKGRRKEALTVAWSLFSLIVAVLGGLTIIFMFAAGPIMSLVTPGFHDNPELRHLTIELAKIMFPVVLLLALTGLVVGMLNSFEHFSVPALTPVVWNLIIIGCLVFLTPVFEGDNRVYAYAIGVLIATVVQFLLPLPWLFAKGVPFALKFDWRNEHVWRVLKLMFPVTIALGMINFDALINSFFGTLVNSEVPAAIDKAFRIYQLPQGLFSIAIATVIFPTMSRLATRGDINGLRHTMANGTRQVLLTLVPSAVIMMVLATPITRLVYERGEFGASATHLVSQGMFWWALSLPAQGASLLFSRTLFSIQRPWVTTAVAFANMGVNALISLALYKPFGLAGVVLGSVAGTLVMAVSQAVLLRKPLGGIEGGRTLMITCRIAVASVLLGGVSYGVWYLLDKLFGRSLPAQIVSVGGGIGAGIYIYARAVLRMRVTEAHQIRQLVGARRARTRSA
jgi:putative peptidoglycan lipid II flippase